MNALREHARVLRHRDFRLLWLGRSFSVIGDGIVVVALALFVTDLSGSATDLGLVLAAHALPLVVLLPIGGVWADRLPRQRVIQATNLVCFALHALLAVLILTDAVEIWHVVVIEALFGSAEAFFRPASTAIIPEVVPELEIQEANAVTTFSSNVAEFAGPALATALVLGAGAGTAFALDAATFLVSAALIARMRTRRRDAEEPAARDSWWREIREGFAEVRSRSWVWVPLAAFSLSLFFALAPWFVLGPIVAEDQYDDVAVYGIASAALGVGTIAGSIAGLRWRPRYPLRMAMLLITGWTLASVLYAVGAPLAIVIVAMALSGAGIALFDVWWITALAERIPLDKLSRVTSYDWMVLAGLLPLGYLLAGPLAERIGAVEVLIVGSALGFVCLLAGLLSREVRMLPRTERPAAATTPHAEHPHIP